MKGKISKIKNTKGELALPVTTVEAIYMEDGITKLSEHSAKILSKLNFIYNIDINKISII